MKTILNFIKKNRNIILLIISFVFLTMLILGMTYAYFDLKTGGETESTMNIGGAEISATYSFSNSINITDALPGNGVIAYKDITLTYKNTSSEEYNVYLKTVIDYSTFTKTENDGVLYYDIYSGTDHSTLVQDKTIFPTITHGKAILKEISIPANSTGTLNYRINFYFPKSDKLQNPNGQLVLNASISVESDNALKYTPILLKKIDLMYQYESGTNGLEQDDTNDQNLRYVGAEPRNYVEFANTGELWRIVGVFNVKDSTGKVERKIKLVRDESLGGFSWDATGNNNFGFNDWTEADLMQELNGDYLDTTLTANKTNWYNSYGSSNGTVLRQTGVFDYTKVIKSNYQNMISESVWNIGGNGYSNPSSLPYGLPLLDQYNKERGTITYQNSRPTEWTGKVGLIYASDYGYASTNSECRENLRAGIVYDKTLDYTNTKCKLDNWLQKSSWYWTLSPYSGNSRDVFIVNGNGVIDGSNAFITRGVFPAVFLKSDILIASGTGEKTSPYKLSL
mgnify:CR=1 FL=1